MSKRIAIFTCEYAPYPGGIATYTRELARAALEVGHEPVVHVFVRREGTIPDDGFEIVHLRPDSYSHRKLPQLTFEISKALARRRFDTVFAADLQSSIAAAPVVTRAEKRAAVHGTDVQSRLLTCFFSTPLFRPLAFYKRICANSNFTRQCLLQTHPYLGRQNVMVAPLGVSEYWHHPVPRADQERTSHHYCLGRNQFVLLSLGRIERRKGIHQAIEALALLPDDTKQSLTYLVIGREMDGAYQRSLATAASRSGVDIRFLGVLPTEDVRALLHRANILLHSASADKRRIEGFGLAILEGAACGLPSLITQVDALPEVVKAGITGFIVEDNNVPALSAKLDAIIKERDALSRMANACRQHARTYSWRRCATLTFE